MNCICRYQRRAEDTRSLGPKVVVVNRYVGEGNFANLPAQSLLEMVECVSAAFLLDSLAIFLSHTYKNERGGLLN